MTSDQALRFIIKPAVFISCLLPLAWLLYAAFADALGPNPIEALLRQSGDWVLRFLLITLSMTPLRKITGWSGWIRLRRMLGLYTFFYAVLHFTIYIWLDRELLWSEVLVDIGKRPYITVGFTALVLMIPLALTSTRGWQRRLGRNWKKLHQLVYISAVGGVFHYLWLVKADTRDPLIYAGWLLVVLALRAWWQHRRQALITN